MDTRLVIGYTLILLFVGGVLGALLMRSCSPTPTESVQVVHRTDSASVDSIRAVITAEVKAGIRPKILLVRRSDTLREIQPDTLSAAIADTLLMQIDALLREREEVEDLVATARTETPLYDLVQEFRYRGRQFSHQLTTRSTDTTRVETVPCESNWWDTVKDYALVALAAVVGTGILVKLTP